MLNRVSRSSFAARLALVCLAIAWIAVAPARAQPIDAFPAPVNVMQDCWTTDLQEDSDLEKELYTFAHDDAIFFVWKHKLMQLCRSYRASLVAYDCVDGKPSVFSSRIRVFQSFAFGPIEPNPFNPEPIFAIALPPTAVPPGRYDWLLITECDDTNNLLTVDGDIDDVCGLNAGLLPITNTPVILGPEPIGIGDRDPGGSPPGRGPGEDGSTRPWCFTVEEPPPPFDLCPPQDCGTFADCAAGPEFCLCFELYDSPGTGGCIADAACGVDCSANGTADCAAGEVCIFNTCCGYPNCVPAQCGAADPGRDLSLPTNAGR